MPATCRDHQVGVLYQLQFVWVQMQSFPQNFPHCGFRYLQLSNGSPHKFPGAASECFTHSINRLFSNIWPPHTTLSLMTNAASVTKLFIPPSDQCLRRTTMSKLPSQRALHHHKTVTSHKFQDSPTTLGL